MVMSMREPETFVMPVLARRGATLVSSMLLGAALLGCEPHGIGDLARPALVVVAEEGGGFCSEIHAVDAGGAVFYARTCGGSDNGLVRRERTVGGAERSELDAAMDAVLALPDDPDCALVSPSGRRFRFLRAEGSEDAWADTRLCEPGVPLPALDLYERMRAIAAPPAGDAGAAADGG
jgi:hypothetical protein